MEKWYMKVKNRKFYLSVKVINLFFFICLLAGIVFSQTPSGWTRLSTTNKDLTAFMPSDFIVVNEDGEVSLYASLEGVSFQISKKKVENPKDYVKKLDFPDSHTEVSNVGEFFVKKAIYDVGKGYAIHLYIASSKNYYYVSTSSDTKDNSSLVRFTNSLMLGGKSIFATDSANSYPSSPFEVIEKLRSSSIVKVALESKCEADIKYGFDTNRDDKTPVSANNSASALRYSRPLIILRRPKAGLNEMPTHKTVSLRVLFQANGCVGPIVVIAGGKNAETTAALKAAAQIKFLPAELAGKPTDIVKIIEYSFGI